MHKGHVLHCVFSPGSHAAGYSPWSGGIVHKAEGAGTLSWPGVSHASWTKAVIAGAGVSSTGALSALRGPCALQPLRVKEETTAHFLLRTFSL